MCRMYGQEHTVRCVPDSHLHPVLLSYSPSVLLCVHPLFLMLDLQLTELLCSSSYTFEASWDEHGPGGLKDATSAERLSALQVAVRVGSLEAARLFIRERKGLDQNVERELHLASSVGI